MMGAFGAALGLGALLVALRLVHLNRFATQVTEVSSKAYADLRDPKLDDAAKGAAMQSHAKRLIRLCGLIWGGLALALASSVGVVLGLDLAGVSSFQSVTASALSWPFILVSSVAVVGLMLATRRT